MFSITGICEISAYKKRSQLWFPDKHTPPVPDMSNWLNK